MLCNKVCRRCNVTTCRNVMKARADYIHYRMFILPIFSLHICVYLLIILNVVLVGCGVARHVGIARRLKRSKKARKLQNLPSIILPSTRPSAISKFMDTSSLWGPNVFVGWLAFLLQIQTRSRIQISARKPGTGWFSSIPLGKCLNNTPN